MPVFKMTAHVADRRVLLCVAVLVVLGCEVNSKKIPNYVTICKISNPEYDSCLLKTIDTIKPRLAKGISKMRIPPTEPFRLPALEVNRNTDALKVKLKVKDVKAFGGSNFIINSLKADPKGLTSQASITFPQMYVEAEYDIEGRLLLIPLKGKGLFKGNFTNIKADVSGKAKVMTTNGVKHIEIETIKSKTRILGETGVKFVSSDSQNDGITSTAVNFFNQNKQQVYSIIYPIMDETADEIILQIANSIMVNLPYDEILPN